LTRRGPKEVAVVDDDAARGRQWRHEEVALLTWEMVPGNALCGEERTNRGGNIATAGVQRIRRVRTWGRKLGAAHGFGPAGTSWRDGRRS
jgi:hypothetical protein